MTKIKPIGDQVIVEVPPRKEITSGGTIIPSTATKERAEEGVVVAVGTGKVSPKGILIPMSVKRGDKILFSKYGYSEITIGDKEYVIIRNEDVLAIIE